MNITAKLAHDTLALIADINRTQPVVKQETAPASSPDAMPVETLAALNHAGWMKLLMEKDDWRETEGKLQEVFGNWMGRYSRRELRHMATDWTREPEDKTTSRLLELWVADEDLKRLAQLVSEMEFPEPKIPVCFVIANARITVRSVLDFVRDDWKLTPEGIAEGLR